LKSIDKHLPFEGEEFFKKRRVFTSKRFQNRPKRLKKPLFACFLKKKRKKNAKSLVVPKKVRTFATAKQKTMHP